MIENSYWAQEFPYPYGPSEENVNTYRKYMTNGTTLLLGYTKKLIPFTDNQMDIDPMYKSDTMIIGDWSDNKTYYDNIIGDGVVNFTKELQENLLKMASKYCKRFIVRSFNYKLDKMRIAANFPKESDFSIKPNHVEVFNEYTFYVWEF
jgi:hypothetical protein